MQSRQRGDLLPIGEHERAGTDKQRINPALNFLADNSCI
jgi:hypothetical protein